MSRQEEKSGDMRIVSPGAKALGAMETAARRAREVGTEPGPAPRGPYTHPGRDRATAWLDVEDIAEERPAMPTTAAAVPREHWVRPDRWLAVAVGVAGVLVLIAAIALAVSLSNSSPAPLASPARTHTTTHNGGTATPSSTPSSTPATAPQSTSTTSIPPSLATPGGAPVIASLSPSSGSSGQTLQVTGSNFLSSDGQIVATFGGQVAPTSCPTQTTCTVTVPPGSPTSGTVPVTITTSAGTSNSVTFTYG